MREGGGTEIMTFYYWQPPNARNRIHSHSFSLHILFLLYNLVVASKPTQTVSYGDDVSLGSYMALNIYICDFW